MWPVRGTLRGLVTWTQKKHWPRQSLLCWATRCHGVSHCHTFLQRRVQTTRELGCQSQNKAAFLLTLSIRYVRVTFFWVTLKHKTRLTSQYELTWSLQSAVSMGTPLHNETTRGAVVLGAGRDPGRQGRVGHVHELVPVLGVRVAAATRGPGRRL